MKAIALLKEYKSIDYGCDNTEFDREIEEAITELEAVLKAKDEEIQKMKCCHNCEHKEYQYHDLLCEKRFECCFYMGEKDLWELNND